MSNLPQILKTFGDLVGKCMHVFLATVTLNIFKHFSLIVKLSLKFQIVCFVACMPTIYFRCPLIWLENNVKGMWTEVHVGL